MHASVVGHLMRMFEAMGNVLARQVCSAALGIFEECPTCTDVASLSPTPMNGACKVSGSSPAAPRTQGAIGVAGSPQP